VSRGGYPAGVAAGALASTRVVPVVLELGLTSPEVTLLDVPSAPAL
jgi:hypothetical protein